MRGEGEKQRDVGLAKIQGLIKQKPLLETAKGLNFQSKKEHNFSNIPKGDTDLCL